MFPCALLKISWTLLLLMLLFVILIELSSARYICLSFFHSNSTGDVFISCRQEGKLWKSAQTIYHFNLQQRKDDFSLQCRRNFGAEYGTLDRFDAAILDCNWMLDR